MSPFHARQAWWRPRRAWGSPRRAAPRSGAMLTDPDASRPRRLGGGPALTSRRATARRRCRAPAGKRRGRERPAGTVARCPAGPARRPGPPTSHCAGARTARSRTRPAAPPPRPPPSSACRRRARAAATGTGARPSASPAPPLIVAANRATATALRGRCLERPHPSSPLPSAPDLPPPSPHGRAGLEEAAPLTAPPRPVRGGLGIDRAHLLHHRSPYCIARHSPQAVRSCRSRRPRFWRSLQPPKGGQNEIPERTATPQPAPHCSRGSWGFRPAPRAAR